MCGICGVVASDSHRDDANPLALEQIVRRMNAAMLHRGPDAAGMLTDPGIALGMRRLSIIDRATGLQPLFSEDEAIAGINNGEVYNFLELRTELEHRGYRFRTRSDTEAIVHAYEAWGDDALARLRGMFAVAIYDRRARRLLLARDRLGIKPLYYTSIGGRLLFASEVRALLASGMVSRQVSRAGIESYLLFGSVGEPDTLIEGVHSLPPGHALRLPLASATTFDAAKFEAARPEPYWTLPLRINGHSHRASHATATEAAQVLRELLEDSVRVHLISDEPLGVFLSGGVDSTSIAALASRVRSGVHGYTVSFQEREFDESAVARRTARQLGVEHRELKIDANEMLNGLETAIAALDQPSVDGINTWCVSAAVRQAGAKVALSGLGGDELFGGYRTFRWMPRLRQISSLARYTPSPIRHAGAQAIATAGAWVGRAEDSDRLASIWREPEAWPHPFYFTRNVFGPREVRRLLHRVACDPQPAWRTWIDQTADAAMQPGLGAASAVSYLELRSYMLNTLLRDADAMSMAHSLELRVPLLDHPIVEFVAAQPDAVKYRPGVYKSLLVQALGDLLPADISTRPKRGFTFPWARWTRGPLAPQITSRLGTLAPALADCLRGEAVAATWDAFRAGRCGWLRPWSLYVLNEWSARHL